MPLTGLFPGGATGLPLLSKASPLDASIHLALPVSGSVSFILYPLTVPSEWCGLETCFVVCLVGSPPLVLSNDPVTFFFFFPKTLSIFLIF